MDANKRVKLDGVQEPFDSALAALSAWNVGMHTLSDESQRQLAHLFSLLDRDGDGSLCADDLVGCFDVVGKELDANSD